MCKGISETSYIHVHTYIRASDCGCSSVYVRTYVHAYRRVSDLSNVHKSAGLSILVLLGIFKTIAGVVCCCTVRVHQARAQQM